MTATQVVSAPAGASFCAEEADRVCAFFENVLCLAKGKWAKRPFIPSAWQRNHILRPVFGTLRPDGFRQYREVYLSFARKNGKSAICAGIGNYLNFADRANGRLEQMGEVYSVASDKDQARVVFDMAVYQVEQSPTLSAHSKIYRSRNDLRIVNTKTGTFYRALSSDARTKHGFNASGVIYDELHTARDGELLDVMKKSMGTREQPLMIYITTAGADTDTPCGEKYLYAKRCLEDPEFDPSFFAYICELDRDMDWRDERLWPLANPGLGEFRDIYEMRSEFLAASRSPKLENDFRRYYLNQWVSSEVRAISLHTWDELKTEDPPDLAGRVAYGGLDLGDTQDLTAFCLAWPGTKGEKHHLKWWYWIPEDRVAEAIKRDRKPYDQWIRDGWMETTPGNCADYEAIMRRILEIARERRIAQVTFDRWGAASAKIELQRIFGESSVYEFGNSYASFSPPTKEFLAMVEKARISHDGNPVTRFAIDSLEIQSDPNGLFKPVKFTKKRNRRRIDGAVAAIMALDRLLRNTGDYTSVIQIRQEIEAGLL